MVLSLFLVMALSLLLAQRLPYKLHTTSTLAFHVVETSFLLAWYAVLATAPYAGFVLWRHFTVRQAGFYSYLWLLEFIICLVWSGFKRWYPFERGQ